MHHFVPQCWDWNLKVLFIPVLLIIFLFVAFHYWSNKTTPKCHEDYDEVLIPKVFRRKKVFLFLLFQNLFLVLIFIRTHDAEKKFWKVSEHFVFLNFVDDSYATKGAISSILEINLCFDRTSRNGVKKKFVSVCLFFLLYLNFFVEWNLFDEVNFHDSSKKHVFIFFRCSFSLCPRNV